MTHFRDKAFCCMIIIQVASILALCDEVIFHEICVTYDIETIFGRFGPLEVLNAGK